MISTIHSNKSHPKLVSIGSISAASLLIRAFSDQPKNVTAIVPTTDTGSSTGIIRKKFSQPAPGDVRAVLSAMADCKGERAIMKELFEYRFKPEHLPELPNLAVGNLLLAVLSEIMGSYEKGVKAAAKILGVKGRVLPVTTANTHIGAILADGSEVWGEEEVRRLGKPPIRKLLLEDATAGLGNGVADAIREADLIVIGPGCFFTSILACLIVPGMNRLLRESGAKKVFCCNATTTPGQTDGFSVFDQVRILTEYLGDVPPRYALINMTRPRPEVERAYAADHIYPLLPSPEEVDSIEALGCRPVLADLCEEQWYGKRMLHKLDSLRHDPEKVKKALTLILGERD